MSNELARRDARRKRFAQPVSTGYGFVSRGEDDRLQKSESARTTFFDEIQRNFVNFSEAGRLKGYSEKVIKERLFHELPPNLLEVALVDPILESLRKLREALLKDKASEFSKRVFLFSVRVAAPTGKYQTYIPSIAYLLHQARALLKRQEVVEMVNLLILHVLHFNDDSNRAIQLYFEYDLQDRRLLQIINAWAVGNYNTWIRHFNTERDGSRYAIMAQGAFKMVSLLVSEFSVSFFTMDHVLLRNFLPTGVDLEQLVLHYGCTWRSDGAVVVIRERGRKT